MNMSGFLDKGTYVPIYNIKKACYSHLNLNDVRSNNIQSIT